MKLAPEVFLILEDRRHGLFDLVPLGSIDTRGGGEGSIVAHSGFILVLQCHGQATSL